MATSALGYDHDNNISKETSDEESKTGRYASRLQKFPPNRALIRNRNVSSGLNFTSVASRGKQILSLE